MHGCNLAFDLPVNAEIDSMEGVVEVGDGVGTSPSLRHATIDKVQADLRQKYDFRDEKRRELDFLEKGGDPLEFIFGNAASTSFQSTSLTDQAPELFVTSEAKGSIAFTASTHGDSVESSGAPGMQSACEPISADNLMLFDVDTDSIEGDKISKQPKKNKFALADLSFNLDGSENAKDIGDSGSVGLAKIAYNRRRYKSQPGRHSACSSSSDMVLTQGINGSSLHSFDGHGDFEGLVTDRGQDPKVPPNGDLELMNPISAAGGETAPSNTQMDMGLGIVKGVESVNDPSKDDPANDAKDSDDPRNVDSLCGVHKYPRTQTMEEPYPFRTSEEVAVEVRPYVPVTVIKPHNSANVDVKISPNGSVTNNIGLGSNILESVSSCNQTRHSLDGNNDTGVQANGRCLDTSGAVTDLASTLGGHETIQVDHVRKERDELRANENEKLVINECDLFKESVEEQGFLLKADEGTNSIVSGFENEVEKQAQNESKDQGMIESMDVDSCGVSEAGRITDAPSSVNVDPKDDNFCKAGPEVSSGPSIGTLPKTEPPAGVSDSASVVQTLSVTDLKENRADEDLILEEARIIEAKRKRIAQLSLSISSVDFHRRSHWDFVLQEMAWLANDFAQERLWKISAASQVGRSVSLLSRMRIHEQNSIMESRKKARFLARSVMEFWHSLERKSQGTELLSYSKHHSPSLREYALRFRKNQSLEVQNVQVQAPVTPDRVSDVAITHTSLDDRSQEETILYAIPPGAMQRYINSVKSYTAKYERTGSSIPEELETSASDAAADNANEEGEGETSTYNLQVAHDASKSSNYSQKNLKVSTRAYGARNLEVVADSPFMHCVDNKVRSQHVIIGKRPADSLNVSFHTKRMRSSNRQRVLSSFTAGPSAYVQGPTKTDASSGDTNSFQDDQNTFDGVSPALNNLELESVGDFEKHLGYESAEVSTQMKRKKARHLGSAYEQRWLVDCNFQSDQRDHSKKRLDSHQFESNGSRGLFGHHSVKKSKMMRQSIDNAMDNSAQLGRFAPSPVASQTSNPNRFIKDVGRDRGKKTKLLMIPATSQSGSGSPWSLFEEQALVVLVHDLGPNWGLVSDAINSTLQFKCIFRNPKECKERHKQMMDMTSGDGADSAEDSGSSQKNNSTLPGIPTGYARQLFQRLQGPLEEDTVKSHFEKIITIGQKLRCRKKQEPKQIQPPHGSHMVALTQVSPNNLNGFPILTPGDLAINETESGSDALPLGFAGGHSGILPVSNSANSPVVASGNMTMGNSFSSSPVLANSSSLRDSRYAISKSASLTYGEQKIQQYNKMLAGRNASQSNLPSPPANDHGARMLPGGNGVVAITAGGKRRLPIGGTGYQGIASSPMASAANMSSSSMATMPSPVHAGVGCVRGNPVRPHEASHMIQATQNQDPQRQVMLPELQMQVTQGSNQGVSPYAAITSSFPNQTSSPPVPSYPIHHQQPHPQQLHSISPRHPHVQGNNHPSNLHHAYAVRLAKDRQMQQRRLQLQQQQQQQQQFPPHNNSLMPHVQSQAQLPVSSPPPPQNSPQVPAQTTTVSYLNPGSPMTTVPQHEQQHQMMPHGFAQNAQSANSNMTNQTGKQRRRQPPNKQKQQTLSQQQGKVLNRLGQGNAVHQNMAIEASAGVSSVSENGEQSTHLLQGQGLYSSKPMNPVSAGKPLVRQSSNLSQPAQRLLAGQVSSMSKHHLQQMPCNSDGVNQGQVSPVSPSNQQHSQFSGRPKLANQRQLSAEGVLQQNHHLNPESTKLKETEPQKNDQLLMANSSKRGTVSTSSRASNDIASVPNAISPASSTPWRGSELAYDSSISNPAAHPSASTEPSSQVGQGSGERHVSDNLPSEGHDVGTRWQQKPAHLQQPPRVFQQLQQQQESSSQQQSMPLSVSQPQTPLMGSMYVRPPDAMLE